MSQGSSPGEGSHSPLREVGEQIRHLWWIPLLTGLVSIGLGLAILATDWTVHALAVITGLVFIIRGIALAFSPAYAGRTSGEQIAAGTAGVIAGVVLVAWPGPSLLVLAFFTGAWLAVSGGFHIVTSVSRRHELPHWGFTFAAGGIELLLGIWAMRRPEATLALLITIIGLWAVLTGVIYCALAFEIRNATHALAKAADLTRGDSAQLAGQLDRLARLHAQGVLSTEEYAQLKASLLAAYNPGPVGHEPGDITSSGP
jgi:uncharacterized membrane protein HdeD (DUF308 family)